MLALLSIEGFCIIHTLGVKVHHYTNKVELVENQLQKICIELHVYSEARGKKRGKVSDTLSRRVLLLKIMNNETLRFEMIKEIYDSDKCFVQIV
jgi:hypothetical protein